MQINEKKNYKILRFNLYDDQDLYDQFVYCATAASKPCRGLRHPERSEGSAGGLL